MTKAPHPSSAEAQAIAAEFVRTYAFGLSPRLDELWLRAVEWEKRREAYPELPHDADPYPPHR